MVLSSHLIMVEPELPASYNSRAHRGVAQLVARLLWERVTDLGREPEKLALSPVSSCYLVFPQFKVFTETS